MARSDDGLRKLDLTLGAITGAETKLFAKLKSSLGTKESVGDSFQLQFSTGAEFSAQFSLPALTPLPATIPRPDFSGDFDIGLTFARKSSAAPMVLGAADGTHFSIGELSGGIRLKIAGPNSGRQRSSWGGT